MTILFTSEDKAFQEKYPQHYRVMQEIDKISGIKPIVSILQKITPSPRVYKKSGESNIEFSEYHLKLLDLKSFAAIYAHESTHAKHSELPRRILEAVRVPIANLSVLALCAVGAGTGLNLASGADFSQTAIEALMATTALTVGNYGLNKLTQKVIEKSESRADSFMYKATGVKFSDINKEFFQDSQMRNSYFDKLARQSLTKNTLEHYFSGYKNISTRKEGGLDHITPTPSSELLKLFEIDEQNRGKQNHL